MTEKEDPKERIKRLMRESVPDTPDTLDKGPPRANASTASDASGHHVTQVFYGPISQVAGRDIVNHPRRGGQ